jgi:hypothetical protein
LAEVAVTGFALVETELDEFDLVTTFENGLLPAGAPITPVATLRPMFTDCPTGVL